jgi:hypothetical protein
MALQKLFETGPEAYVSKLVNDESNLERLL